MRNNCRLPVESEKFKIRLSRGRHTGLTSHFEVRIAFDRKNVSISNRTTKSNNKTSTKHLIIHPKDTMHLKSKNIATP